MAKEEMFTTGKIAEQFGVPAAKVKKAIETLQIEPDLKKGGCAYFSAETVKKIKTAI